MKKLSGDIIKKAENNAKPVKDKKNSRFLLSAFEWMQAAAIAVVSVVLVMTFVCRIVDVNGRSMLNTLFDGDKVLVYTFMYTPKRGDVVVISHAQKYDEPIVKRIIATQGQTVDIDFSSGEVTVDGQVLDEPYLTFEISGKRSCDDISFPVTVPDNCIFVLGDNRIESLDGRSSMIGFIDCDDIVGKAVCIVFPFYRVSAIH